MKKFIVVCAVTFLFSGICIADQGALKDSQHDNALQAKMKVAAEEDPLACAFILTQTIHNPAALSDIAIKYAEIKQYDRAFQIVESIDDNTWRIEALGGIALEEAKNKEFDKAMETVNVIQNYSSRLWHLRKIAIEVAKIGQKDSACRVLSQALQVAKTIEKNSVQLEKIAIVYAEIGEYKEAFQVTEGIEEPFAKGRALIGIVKKFAQDEQQDKKSEILSQTFQVAEKIKDINEKSEILKALVIQYAEVGQNEKARRIIEMIEYKPDKTEAVIVMADKYSKAGQNEQATQILWQNFKEAREIGDSSQKCEILGRLAIKSIEIGQDGLVSQIIDKLVDVLSQTKLAGMLTFEGTANLKAYSALVDIVAKYAEMGMYEKAITITERLDNSKTWAFKEIVVKYAKNGKFKQALQMADTINDAFYKSSALVEVANIYAKVGQKYKASQVLSQATKVCGSLDNRCNLRNDVLIEIIGAYLDIGQYEKALSAAEMMDTYNDNYRNFEKLTDISAKYAERGQYKEALQIVKMMRKGSSQGKDGYIYFNIRRYQVEALTRIADKYEKDKFKIDDKTKQVLRDIAKEAIEAQAKGQ